MAEVVLPIPNNGGTLSNPRTRKMFRLSGDKFVILYHQTAPNLIICQVVQINNIKSATPSVTTLRTEVLQGLAPRSNNWSFLQTYGVSINATDFLVVLRSDGGAVARVFTIDPVTNVVTAKSANTLDWGMHSQSNIETYIGKNLDVKKVFDNVVMLSGPLTAWSDAGQTETYTIVYNTGTNQITRTTASLVNMGNDAYRGRAIHTITDSRPSVTPSNSRYVSIVYQLGASGQNSILLNTTQQHAGFKVVKAVFGSPTTAPTYTTSWIHTGISASAPYLSTSETTGIVFVGLDRYRTFNGTSWSTTDIKAATPTPSPTNMSAVWATWLGPDYILVEGATAESTTIPTTLGRQFRVYRYFDDNTIVPTAATGSTNLTLFNGTSRAFQTTMSPDREIYDQETILMYGYDALSPTGNMVMYVLNAPSV